MEGRVGIIDELAHLGVDFEIEGFFLEYGANILETIIDGIHMFPVLAGGALLILLHLSQEGTDILIELSQPSQEVFLRLVHFGTSSSPLVLSQLVGTLLLDFVDATHSRDYLVVDRLRTHVELPITFKYYMMKYRVMREEAWIHIDCF